MTRVHVLYRDECLDLLKRTTVGRIAVVEAGAPVIFPVNFVLDGDDLVFRTDPGTKLERGLQAPVCFEVDEIHEETESGWSVIVKGRLEEMNFSTKPALKQHLEGLGLRPWAGGEKRHWLRLVPSVISGRRITANGG